MIEVLAYRYGAPLAYECDSVEEALSSIEFQEDDGQQSTVGIMVDGQPHIWDGYITQDPPNDKQAEQMRKSYAEVQRTGADE